jgi:ABC-2 type transport system ATP-binding protein
MIQARGLTRYYGEFAALNDVSFDVGAGQIVGLLGRNGAGKTTAFKILAGLIQPSAGTVMIDGVDVATAPDSFKARIGFLPERPPVYEDMTVTAFLAHAGRLKGMSAADVARRIPEVVELAALQGREKQVIGTLSHGFRKRVGIAQTVLHDPKLIVLDEPISGLDPKQIAELRPVIRRLGEGRVVLVSSHILSEVGHTCDHILVLHGGKLVAEGTLADLTARVGAARVDVTIRGDGAALTAWLGQRPDVVGVVEKPGPAGFTTVRVSQKTDERERLVAELVGAGFAIRNVADPMDDLEEVFLRLTGGEA